MCIFSHFIACLARPQIKWNPPCDFMWFPIRSRYIMYSMQYASINHFRSFIFPVHCIDFSIKGNEGLVHPQNLNSAVFYQSVIGKLRSVIPDKHKMLVKNVQLARSFAMYCQALAYIYVCGLMLSSSKITTTKKKVSKGRTHKSNVIKWWKPISVLSMRLKCQLWDKMIA